MCLLPHGIREVTHFWYNLDFSSLETLPMVFSVIFKTVFCLPNCICYVQTENL